MEFVPAEEKQPTRTSRKELEKAECLRGGAQNTLVRLFFLTLNLSSQRMNPSATLERRLKRPEESREPSVGPLIC